MNKILACKTHSLQFYSNLNKWLTNHFAQEYKRNVFSFMFFTLLFFSLFLAYVNSGYFIDEADNILGGMVIYSGGAIYKDFFSQHTPIMYYILAACKYFGANSIEAYRVIFYAILSLSFSMIYIGYKKYTGHTVLILYPIIHIASFASNPDVSYSIVAEQIQSLCYVIFVLEAIRTSKKAQPPITTYTIISLTSFIAIGVAFLSIYAVAIINIYIISKIIKNSETIKKSLATYLIISITPFALFLIYYYSEDNFWNLIYQSYIFNREIYSKYLAQSGENPLILFTNTVIHLINILNPNSYGEYFLDSFRKIINPISNLLACYILYKANKTIGVVVFLIILSSLVRGANGFHAIHYWALSSLTISISINYLANKRKNHPTSIPFILTMFLLAISIATPYYKYIHTNSNNTLSTNENYADVLNKDFFVDVILNKNESFFETSLNPYAYILTNRTPSTQFYGMVPWIAEIAEDSIINQIEEKKVKLIFHNPNNSVWGYVLKDYAPKLNSYIADNYINLPNDFRLAGGSSDDVYVRKEIYNDTLRKLVKLKPNLFNSEAGLKLESSDTPAGEIYANRSIAQTFTAERNNLNKISILFATYARINNADIIISLYSDNSQLINSKTINAASLSDNSFYTYDFPEISNSSGKQYTLKISSPGGTTGNSITAWLTVHSQNKDIKRNTLTIGDINVKGHLSMKLFYRSTHH